jgi:hypothetical protein
MAIALSRDRLAQAAEAARLADQLRDDLDTLRRGVPSELMNVLVRLRQQVAQAEVAGKGRLTPAGLQEQIDQLRNRALQAIDTLEAQARSARSRIEAALAEAEARALAAQDVQAAILRELREQRAWARLAPLLDTYEPEALMRRLQDLAKLAADQEDEITLAVLEAELPFYLERRKLVPYIEPALVSVREARLPHLPPAVRQAIQVRQELAQGWPRLMAAFGMARQAASGQARAVVALPGWRPGEQVQP